MKEIITDNNYKVSVSDIDNDSIVGVYFKATKERVFVIQKGDKFIGVDVEKRNTSIDSLWTAKSIQEYIYLIEDTGGGKAYLFNDFKELLNWITV